MRSIPEIAICSLLLWVIPSACAQFTYITNADNTLTVTGYTGALVEVTIPSNINNHVVTSVGGTGFQGYGLIDIGIPDTVTCIRSGTFKNSPSLFIFRSANGLTNIGDYAFQGCTGLRDIYFAGNAPVADATAFLGDTDLTIFRLWDATGWAQFSSNTGLAVNIWNPMLQSTIINNQRGFTITGPTNAAIIVQASTNLAVWTNIENCKITNGSIDFTDVAWTNYSRRFYRVSISFP